jgi:hypothetical protein
MQQMPKGQHVQLRSRSMPESAMFKSRAESRCPYENRNGCRKRWGWPLRFNEVNSVVIRDSFSGYRRWPRAKVQTAGRIRPSGTPCEGPSSTGNRIILNFWARRPQQWLSLRLLCTEIGILFCHCSCAMTLPITLFWLS